MLPFEQAKAVYSKEPCRRSFETDLALHFEFGFVFSTPRFFCMGRPVQRSAPHGLILDPSYTFKPEECDTWLVWLMAGDVSAAWSVLPWPLPWLCFERR